MRWFSNITGGRVSLADIDCGNQDYHVCKPPDRERLLKTAQRFGLPEKPVLMKKDGVWIAITGHEALSVLSELGQDRCEAYIVDSVPWDEYARFLLWKNLYNELSALGKLRVLALISNEPGVDKSAMHGLLREGLQIAEYFLSSRYETGWVNSLPLNLARYLHYRDAGFKVMNNLLSLPAELLEHISGWVGKYFLRLNTFREIVGLTLDIVSRDGTAEGVLAINPGNSEDVRSAEEYLMAGIQRLRYPRYHELKSKSDLITSVLRGKGIEAAVPPFFEGNSVDVRVRIGKHHDVEDTKKRFSLALEHEIRELLNLL